MPGPVTVMFAFCPKQESVQPLVLPDGIKASSSSREKLMDISLVADIKNQFIFRRIENVVQCNRQLYHAKVWPKMTTCLRKNRDEFLSDLLRKLMERSFFQPFQV